jgi:Mg2+ and Co2+ transporter CorA
MTSSLLSFIGDIESRLKRLEENIGSVTDVITNFMAIEEEIGISDSLTIYKRDVNDSFLIGTHKVGIDEIGDRRSAAVLLYSS